MKTKIAAVSALAGLIIYGWLAMASAILCFGTSKANINLFWRLFVFPYVQWAEVVPWWRHDPLTKQWLGIGAAVPTVIVILITIGIIRQRFRGKRLHTPFSVG